MISRRCLHALSSRAAAHHDHASSSVPSFFDVLILTLIMIMRHLPFRLFWCANVDADLDSALKSFYKQRKVQLDEDVKTRLRDFKSGILIAIHIHSWLLRQ
jgi:hypothetical protein